MRGPEAMPQYVARQRRNAERSRGGAGRVSVGGRTARSFVVSLACAGAEEGIDWLASGGGGGGANYSFIKCSAAARRARETYNK